LTKSINYSIIHAELKRSEITNIDTMKDMENLNPNESTGSKPAFVPDIDTKNLDLDLTEVEKTPGIDSLFKREIKIERSSGEVDDGWALEAHIVDPASGKDILRFVKPGEAGEKEQTKTVSDPEKIKRIIKLNQDPDIILH